MRSNRSGVSFPGVIRLPVFPRSRKVCARVFLARLTASAPRLETFQAGASLAVGLPVEALSRFGARLPLLLRNDENRKGIGHHLSSIAGYSRSRRPGWR